MVVGPCYPVLKALKTMSNVGSMVDEARKRKERLRALKEKQNSDADQVDNGVVGEEIEKLPKYTARYCLLCTM